MSFLGTIFFGFLGVCATVAFFRSGKVVIRIINHLFDKVDDRFS